jgi:hypothetical protein
VVGWLFLETAVAFEASLTLEVPVMSKKSLSLRTLGIIEDRWSRGISVVSIAGELGTFPHRVQAVVDRLEHDKAVANNGRGKE